MSTDAGDWASYVGNRAKENRRKRVARAKARKPSKMIGRRFGRLVVLRRWAPGGYGCQTLWECRCDCGAIKIVGYASLLGKTRGCGNHDGRTRGRFRKGVTQGPQSAEHRRKISQGVAAYWQAKRDRLTGGRPA